MIVIRAAINHVRSLLFTLPPTNVRQSQMTPIMTPRVTVVGDWMSDAKRTFYHKTAVNRMTSVGVIGF